MGLFLDREVVREGQSIRTAIATKPTTTADLQQEIFCRAKLLKNRTR